MFESSKGIDTIGLGTNDVIRSRTDPDEVNINVTKGTNCVKLVFPEAKKKVYAQFYVEREM